MYTMTNPSVPPGTHKAYFPIKDCQFYKPYAAQSCLDIVNV
jgi:hypothetical protein